MSGKLVSQSTLVAAALQVEVVRICRGMFRPPIPIQILSKDRYCGMLEWAVLAHLHEMAILDLPRKMIDRWYLACASTNREACIFLRDLS